MPTLVATPVVAPRMARSRGPVRIFEARDYDGELYDIDFLDRVVQNFHLYQSGRDPRGFPKPPLIDLSEVPVPEIGIGHEDDQAFLRWLLGRTDLPAAGWPTRLERRGSVLYAMFEGMPLEVASLINGSQLAYCSSEFYRNFTDDDGREYGPMLRRVSLLGGEIPRVKSLGRLPQMVYSEPPSLGQRRLVCFSELSSMNDEILQKLASFGINTAVLAEASVPDEVLQEFLRVLEAGNSPPAATPEEPPVVTASEEDAIGAGSGESPTVPPPIVEDPTAEPTKPAIFSEKKLRALIETSVNVAVAKATAGVKPALAQLTAAAKEKERSEIQAFCERLRREGKLEPSELNPLDGQGKPRRTIVDRILAMDTRSVVSFGEKRGSEREAYLAELDARPPDARFAEKMPDVLPAPTGAKGPLSPEERRKALEVSPTGMAILAREREEKARARALS